MRDLKKKKASEDMVVDQTRITPVEESVSIRETVKQGSPEEIKKRLVLVRDAAERKMILAGLQRRFGNRLVRQVIDELRLSKDESPEA